MRRLPILLFFVLSYLSLASAFAQLSGVEMGYGPMGFPSLDGVTESPRGGAAFMNIMFEKSDEIHIGGTLFIGGNSRIAFAGEDIGQGMVGLTANAEYRLGILRFGVFAGGAVYQTYERVDLTKGLGIKDPNPFPTQRLKEKNFQPYGGVKVGVGAVSVSYAPAGNTVLVGIRLFKG